MPIEHQWPAIRRVAGILALPAVLVAALWVPIPHLGDQGAEQVVASVEQRLPGWTVRRAIGTWEGGYAVVASCGASELGFQVVHGHGLPDQDVWLQPNDAFTRSRLEEVTDYASYLIWRGSPFVERSLSCAEELARVAAEARADGGGGPTSAIEGADRVAGARRRPVD